ncbi:hypothetical protein DFP72DRAFT_1082046 [Ephemerocybe angulata]|uniref:Uncharacterized protein n=1 Tax=Ephemerocybe angulata TaxID=980116 RepID=A0A8H6LTR9_9AGAR|nr:hypothetical protein DFP72DRAFT_1082046 [Tulosesus angulatus]
MLPLCTVLEGVDARPEGHESFTYSQEAQQEGPLCSSVVPTFIVGSIFRNRREPQAFDLSNPPSSNLWQTATSKYPFTSISEEEPSVADVIASTSPTANHSRSDPSTFEGGWRILARPLPMISSSRTISSFPTSPRIIRYRHCHLIWLEAYLPTYNHVLAITSHSQNFMDSICRHIVELTFKKNLTYYSGDYSTYVNAKQENRVNTPRFIASASIYPNLVTQVKADGHRQVEAGKPLRFHFKDINPLPAHAIAFANVAFLLLRQEGGRPVQGPVVCMESCIAILGANGTGKSKSTLHHWRPPAMRGSHLEAHRPQARQVPPTEHFAVQLPYDLSPIEFFQKLFSIKCPRKDVEFLATASSNAPPSLSASYAPLGTVTVLRLRRHPSASPLPRPRREHEHSDYRKTFGTLSIVDAPSPLQERRLSLACALFALRGDVAESVVACRNDHPAFQALEPLALRAHHRRRSLSLPHTSSSSAGAACVTTPGAFSHSSMAAPTSTSSPSRRLRRQ